MAQNKAQRTVQLITQSESEIETEFLETRNEEMMAKEKENMRLKDDQEEKEAFRLKLE